MPSDWVRDSVRDYRAKGRRRATYALIMILIIFVVCVYSLSVSRVDISFMEALEVIWHHITGDLPSRTNDYLAWWTDQVVINDNAPRTICGVCVGAILAVSGCVMQSVTRNPLTDPYTIGISSAALFGVSISIAYGVCIIPFLSGDSANVVNAFVFALIPAAAIVLVSSFKRTSSTMMILIGIAIMYMFTAFSTFIRFNADVEKAEEIYEWTLGTLSKTDWTSVYVLVPTFILLVVVMLYLADKINVISAGDNESTSLGENPVRVRIICFVVMSIATAVAVCYTGTIGFVGLVAPHIARLFVGSNNKILIPASAIIGGIMVVGADVLVRLLPQVLPVGVITALIGSPLFLYFLYRQRTQNAW